MIRFAPAVTAMDGRVGLSAELIRDDKARQMRRMAVDQDGKIRRVDDFTIAAT